MSGFLQLPEELVETIVEEMDVGSSRVLSTVSTSFVNTCQRRHFRSLVLATSDSTPPMASGFRVVQPMAASFSCAAALFTTSPHLASYVRDLTVHVSSKDVGDPAKEMDIDTVVQSLRYLKSLTIEGRMTGASSLVYWEQISSNLMPSIYCMIQLPTIRSLSLKRFKSVPSTLITHAVRSFLQFSIDLVEIVENTVTPSFRTDDHPTPSQLEQLSIGNPLSPTEEFILRPEIQSALCGLQSLALHTKYFPPQSLHNLMFLSTLKHLVFLHNVPFPTHLPLLPHLTTLDLQFRPTSTQDNPRPDWKQMFAFTLSNLSFAASTPMLEYLRFAIILDGRSFDPPDSDFIPIPMAPFDVPDYAQRLPHLRQIHCRIPFPKVRNIPSRYVKLAMRISRANIPLEEFSSYMQATFPAPEEDRILFCDASLIIE
ncbi:hypothetical protein C8R43DRAFT_984434 [Mycena crocata]|nr:hypothetical protein C8R43DRAFT_984434 [Mycena crocata]